MNIAILKKLGLPEPKKEYRFFPKRKWKIDYFFEDVGLAVEIEGGVWKNGRHNRASGFVKDIEKYNAITELGYYLLRYQPNQINYDQILYMYIQLKKSMER